MVYTKLDMLLFHKPYPVNLVGHTFGGLPGFRINTREYEGLIREYATKHGSDAAADIFAADLKHLSQDLISRGLETAVKEALCALPQGRNKEILLRRYIEGATLELLGGQYDVQMARISSIVKQQQNRLKRSASPIQTFFESASEDLKNSPLDFLVSEEFWMPENLTGEIYCPVNVTWISARRRQ